MSRITSINLRENAGAKADRFDMRAPRVTISTFGVVAGLAGAEHGIGEVLQGNMTPGALTIQSWPEAEAFSILGGEPAMTLVPNLLVTGILAIVASIAFLVWATAFIERRDGGIVLIALSVLLLLVGGGFGPPLIGLILGVAALKMNRAPSARRPGASGFWRFLGDQWPWLFGAALAAWLMLFPGVVIVSYLFGWDESSSVFTARFSP
jgi:hypothetical protein